jgi:lipopolysaccharide export system permease protein
MKRKILFWYTFRELAGPFALGLLVFTFILLMNKLLKLVEMLINKGISLSEVGLLIWYLLPSFLVLTVPISILLALLICLGKFSGDAELIAMKASGVSLYQLLPPFAVLCIAGFFVTNLLTLYLLPNGNYAFRKGIVDFAKKHSEANLEEGVFIDYFEGIVLYINSFDREENRINGIFLSDRRDAQIPTIIAAEHAVIFADKDNSNILFKLENGSLHRFDQRTRSYQYALFNAYDMNIQLAGMEDEDFKIKYKEMDIGSLWKLSDERKKNNKSAVNINVEIHKRLSFPFACIVFGLLGVSLGCSWHRGGKSYGFLYSLIVVFLYYLLLNIGENLAKSGFLFAFMGVWLPNIMLGSIGLYLFYKVAREEPLPLGIFEKTAGLVSPALQRIKDYRQNRRHGRQ